MRRVWRKVKSNSGASMLFALLVFMLCVLAGTAALTAAAANSGRYTHMEAEQQDYLSVASAARVVKDELVKGTFTAEYTVVEWTKNSTDKTQVVQKNSVGMTGTFEELFKDYFTYIYTKHGWSNADLGNKFAVSFPCGDYSTSGFSTKNLKINGIDGMSEVKLDMDADENFTITATLYSGSDAEPRNKTVIELVGDPTWTEDTKTENYYYVSGTTATGGPAYSVGTKTTVVRNLSVKWTLENATVYDGGRKE